MIAAILDLILSRQINRQDERGPAVTFDLGGRLRELLSAACQQDHVGTGPGKTHRGRAAKAAAGARDQADLPV